MKERANQVTNTASEVRRDPIVGLATAMMPHGIEASEARGQAELLASEVIPSEIQDYWCGEEKRPAMPLLESWGFVFGKHEGGDTLFRRVTLPAGWSRKGSEHAMWSHIVDELGRERCAIFYKAAFYDRRAFLTISGRYSFSHEFEKDRMTDKDYMHGPVRGVWKEGDRVLYAGPWRKDERVGGRYDAYEQAREDAVAWKRDNLPEDIGEQWARP